MQGPIKSIVAGVLSGIATYFASIQALGYTNASVMPSWVSLTIWETVVVLGLGAALVALIVQIAALLVFRARASWSIAAFLGAVFLAMTVSGHLAYGIKTLVANAVGAMLASLAYGKLRPNNSFKPTPLRGAA
ncbi:hypothetical protein [Luteimonas qiangzhengi]|uniref:hypothetical protein n=1 Tax=Luteimonas sp. MJ146 TaxID=3129240 RepID=UPI0031BAC61F